MPHLRHHDLDGEQRLRPVQLNVDQEHRPVGLVGAAGVGGVVVDPRGHGLEPGASTET